MMRHKEFLLVWLLVIANLFSTALSADAISDYRPPPLPVIGPSQPSYCPVPKPPALSLEDAIFLSLRYSPLVRNAEIQRIVDKFNLRVAQWAYELQYSFTGALAYTNTTSNSSHSESTTYNVIPQVQYLSPIGTSITVSVPHNFTHNIGQSTYFNPLLSVVATQPLLRGYGPTITLAPLYNAYDQELSTRLTLRNVVITDITTVITQYTALVQAQNTLKALQLALQASLDTLTQYRAEIKAGRRAPADMVQFEVNVAQQRLSIEAQLVTIQQARLTLLATIGLDPIIQVSVPENVTMNDKNLPDLQQSIQLALRNDIGYQQAKLGLRVLQRQLWVARDAQRWQLNATLTQTFGGGSGGAPNSGYSSFVNGQNKSTVVGLALTVPINNLPLQQQLVNAKNQVDQAEITLAATRRAVVANATNAYYNLISTKQQIIQAQRAVDLAVITLKNAGIRLNYGRSSAFEVATLQNNLTNAQISLINTQISYDNALASFEQVLGITLDRWCVRIRM